MSEIQQDGVISLVDRAMDWGKSYAFAFCDVGNKSTYMCAVEMNKVRAEAKALDAEIASLRAELEQLRQGLSAHMAEKGE